VETLSISSCALCSLRVRCRPKPSSTLGAMAEIRHKFRLRRTRTTEAQTPEDERRRACPDRGSTTQEMGSFPEGRTAEEDSTKEEAVTSTESRPTCKSRESTNRQGSEAGGSIVIHRPGRPRDRRLFRISPCPVASQVKWGSVLRTSTACCPIAYTLEHESATFEVYALGHVSARTPMFTGLFRVEGPLWALSTLHCPLLSPVDGPKPQCPREPCRNRSRSSGVMCSQRSAMRRRKLER